LPNGVGQFLLGGEPLDEGHAADCREGSRQRMADGRSSWSATHPAHHPCREVPGPGVSGKEKFKAGKGVPERRHCFSLPGPETALRNTQAQVTALWLSGRGPGGVIFRPVAL